MANEKINGQIAIYKESTHTRFDTHGNWLTNYTIGAENTITKLMEKFFGDTEQLPCIIEKTSGRLSITILKE